MSLIPIILIAELALIAWAFRVRRKSQGGGVRTALTVVALLAAALLFISFAGQPRIQQVRSARLGHSIGVDSPPRRGFMPRTQAEHDSLVAIRVNAHQPDAVYTRVSGGEGFEIYADGTIVHTSGGFRELFRDPGLFRGSVPNRFTNYQIEPRTLHEYELLKKFRLRATQPDAESNIHGGEGYEQYPDGMVIHVSQGMRTLLRDNALFGDPDSFVAKRLTERQPDMVSRHGNGGRGFETYPDGMQVLEDQDGTRRILVMPGEEGSVDLGNGSVAVAQELPARPTTLVFLIAGLAIAAPLIAAHRRRREGHGTGLGWAAAGVFILGLGGVWFARSQPSAQYMQVAEVQRQYTQPQQWYASDLDEMYEAIHAPAIQLDDVNADAASEANVAAEHADVQAEPNTTDESDDPDNSTEVVASEAAEPDQQEGSSNGEHEDATQTDESTADSEHEGSDHAAVAEDSHRNEEAKPAEDSANIAQAEKQDAQPSTSAVPTPVAAAAESRAPAPSANLVALRDVPGWESDDSPSSRSREMPSWVRNPPNRVGDVNERVVSSGIFSTVEECFKDIQSNLRDEAVDRTETLVQETYNQSRPSVYRMGLGTDEVLRRFCKDQYVETQESSVGDMKRLHVLMQFDEEADQYLLQRWTTAYREERLVYVAFASFVVIGVLSLIYGLFKFDNWTKGYYTKRLFIGVPATIIVFLLLFAAAVS